MITLPVLMHVVIVVGAAIRMRAGCVELRHIKCTKY